jgi:hypothetical protein
MAQLSALPNTYYAVFGLYEPFICVLGFLSTVMDPKSVSSPAPPPKQNSPASFKFYDQQAPWPSGTPPSSLSPASFVTLIQLAHVCALLGVLNFFLLSAVRKHLDVNPAAQENILSAYFTPLVIADFTHLFVTLWALGDDRWNFGKWSSTLWLTFVLGISLLIPRITWHLGIGRYVHTRDRQLKRVFDDARSSSVKPA